MKFSLRKWKASDADHLTLLANNINIARMLTDKFPHPYTKTNADWFIDFANSHKPQQIFAIDIEGKACGGIGIHPQDDVFRKNAELGYWVGEPYWGNGIMTAAIKQIVEYGFKTFEIERIFARPFGSNIASQKLLEKLGFQLEAKFDKIAIKMDEWEDLYVYAVRRDNQLKDL